MNNFNILHNVLRNVGVKFDSNTAENIMQSKPGFIANLLYEIRSNLEKKGVNPENISLKKSSHFQEMYAPMKFRQEIPPYDAFDSKHFYETLQRKTRAQKEIDLENKLKRFEDFKIEQDKKIRQAIAEEQYRQEQEKAINIRNHRNKNQRYHAFLQQFEEKGINNWKNNMLRAKQREIKDVQFQLNEAQKIQKNLYRGIAKNIAIYHHEIKQFEENFGKNGKKRTDLNAGKKEENEKKGESNESHIAAANVGPKDLENMQGNTGMQTHSNFGTAPHFESVDNRAANICSGIYQKIMLDNRTKTERNRRRRKIIVEQGKAQLEIENKRREEQYIGKLAKQSNQEKQLTYETYRVNQCKNIIRENRNLREEMYKKREEGNKEFQKMNEENYLKFHIENFHRDQEKEDNRKKDLEISQKQKQRNQNSDICRSMVDLIVDISDKAYEYQQINDVEEIDPRVWREWTNLFKNNESVLYKPPEENQEKKPVESKEEEEEKEEEKEPEPKPEEKKEENAEEKQNNANPEEKKPEEESIHIDINSRYNKTFYSIFNTGDTSCTKLDQILDECEFYEYQNNKGQWNPEIIPESAFVSLKPEDLTFNYTQPLVNQEQNKKEKGGKNVNAKGGAADKAKPENIEEMMKLEEPNDLIIPKENVKNCLFGDLIGVLIDLKYEEEKKKYQEEKDSRKNLFRYIPIKIALIGKDYAGKRTQAKILSENFPLKIYDLGELVKDALNILSSKRETGNKFLLTNTIKNKTLQKEQQQTPNDNNANNANANNANNTNNANQPNAEANKTAVEQANNTVAQMRTEQAAEEVKYSKIKDLAREIKHRLGNGEGVPDDIYAELLCEYIKIDFPPKEDFEVTSEIIERVSRKEKVKEEIEKNKEENIKRPKTFERKDKELNDELMKISLEASKGFVVVNFHNTYNQAKLLEKILSGYIPKNESRQLKSNKMKNLFSIVLDKSEEILPPHKLILGGFDFIFYINVPGNECIRRAVGRRLFYDIKEKEKIIYHLEDKLPSTDSNICENLKKVGNIDRCESALVTRHLSFENSVDEVISFYQPFGFENKHLKSFEEINGNQEKDYVTQNILTYINQLVELNEEHDQEIYEKHENESMEEEDEGDEEQNISDQLLDGNSAIEDKKDDLMKAGNVANNLLENNEANNLEENKNDSEDLAKEGGDEIGEQALSNKIEENKPLDKYEEYCQKIQKIKDSLNRDLADILLKIWSNLFQNYVCECKSIFKFLRVQRDSISVNYNLICQKFIEFLKRPSKKQILLLDYQMKYNKFLDDYPDLKDDPQVKEEHHQEVDDLNDKIYEIIETRKNEAVEERKKIMTSGWIENEMEKFYMALERLFQNEIDKFIGSLQIMRDYYHNLDNRPLIELPFSTIDIIKEEIDQTPIEEFEAATEENNTNQENNKETKENNTENDVKETLEQYIEKNLPKSYPRVEKLYKNSLKIQFQYEEALREAEKAKLEKEKEENKKNAAPAKGKKGPDKNKDNADEEKKEEVYPHSDELKQAMSNEKAKFKYKLTLLKYWGILCLKNFRRLSLTVYNKLEDWIILAIKAENEALNELTIMLKENIESESKIKYELALDTFDVIVNMDVQNYIELPPKPLPAKEVIDHNKFNIVQLKILMEELQTYLVENTSSIRSSTFISIFLKKYISSKNDNDVYYGIPNMLKNLSFYNYFKFIKKLDPENTDLISLKQIGTFFALLSNVIPTKEELNDIKEQGKKLSGDDYPLVTMSQFTQIKFWFDENEKSPTLKNHEDYHRELKLKEILFDINKNTNQSQEDSESLMDMDEFINIINLECISAEIDKFQGKTYYDILFF